MIKYSKELLLTVPAMMLGSAAIALLMAAMVELIAGMRETVGTANMLWLGVTLGWATGLVLGRCFGIILGMRK